jgi:hypothetical protein
LTDFRVFQGVRGQAGQPRAFTDALKSQGIHSECYCYSVNNFSYDHDHALDFANLQDPIYFQHFFKDLYEKFDIFHFHANSFFSSKHAEYPSFQDLYLLRDLGKKIVFHFRGSEVRIESECRKQNPYHFYDLPDLNVAKIRFDRPDDTQKKVIHLIRSVAHRIYANDPEIQSYIPEATIVPRAFFTTAHQPIYASQQRPLVCHAPSRRALKGTDSVISAVNKLKRKGLDFDFKLIENVSHKDAIKAYRSADIIIDQLRIGWYGVLSVEAMALGKPVMCYIRDDLKQHLPSPAPLIMTTIDTVEKDLEHLILSQDLRNTFGANGLAYFKKNHSIETIGDFLKKDFQKLINEPPHLLVENPEQIIKTYCENILNLNNKKNQHMQSKLSQRTLIMTAQYPKLTARQFTLLLASSIKRRFQMIIEYRKKHGISKTLCRVIQQFTGDR